ncbi:MAG TPA: sortase [Chloroflexia bacterium]|nr:sortase [Chloroflexia bacterium]
MTTQTDTAPDAAVVKPGKLGPSPLMRRLGNLLITLGLLLMLGVGGFLGYQMYDNNLTSQRIAEQHREAESLFDPAPLETPQPSTGGSATAPAAPAATDRVRVSDAPLAKLNTGVTAQQWVSAGLAQGQSKPPLKIEMPRIGVNTPIVPVGWEMIPSKAGQDTSRWKVAEFAAGHHEGTANPGQIGNVVISGHVDWKGEVFKNLHEAKRGDEIRVYTEDREYLYIVQDTQLVLEDGATDEQKRQNARFMDPTPDQTLTLITCYPYGIDDHRFIVIAKPYDSGLPARPDMIVK